MLMPSYKFPILEINSIFTQALLLIMNMRTRHVVVPVVMNTSSVLEIFIITISSVRDRLCIVLARIDFPTLIYLYVKEDFKRKK